MIDENKKYEVYKLIEKASKALKSEDAMRFSQAACNAANALATLNVVLIGN